MVEMVIATRAALLTVLGDKTAYRQHRVCNVTHCSVTNLYEILRFIAHNRHAMTAACPKDSEELGAELIEALLRPMLLGACFLMATLTVG